jgi:hypothetical protein
MGGIHTNNVGQQLRALWPEALLLLITLLLAWPLPVRLVGIGEWLALDAARHMPLLGLPDVHANFVPGMPPLWPWLLSGWAAVAGPGIVAGRLLSAGMGACIVGAVYVLAGQWFQQRWLACLAVALLLTMGAMVGVLGTATPHALLTLLVLVGVGFNAPQQKTRRSAIIGFKHALWQGVLLALGFGTFGLLGLLTMWVGMRPVVPDRPAAFWAFIAPVCVFALVWALRVGLVAGPWAGLQALVLLQPLSFSWGGLLANGLMLLVPWGLFYLPHAQKRHAIRDGLQSRIWPLATLGLLTCGQYPVTAFAPMVPFVALWLTQYLGVDANQARWLLELRRRVDWSMVILIVLALLLTGWVFNYINPEAHWPIWPLPGVPVLTELGKGDHTMPLHEGFPLWKVWLLPIPLGMVIVATVTCLLSWWERFERSVFWLTGGVLALVVLVRLLALPILWPAYERDMANHITTLQRHMRIDRWRITEPRLYPISFSLPQDNATSQLIPSRHVVGLATERYFYQQLFPQAKLYKRLPEVVNLPRLVLYMQTIQPLEATTNEFVTPEPESEETTNNPRTSP